MKPEDRRAARLVVLDSRGRVLLLEHARPKDRPFWATPGGGLEENESFEQAAMREATEELGLVGVQLQPLWDRTADFAMGDRLIRQQERYFLIHHEPMEFDAEVLQTHRDEGILQSRWWSVGEIAMSDEPIMPDNLAEMLSELGIAR